ncbi:MAG: roadblock/LC7 domain-containing protein [Myxococcota bacterium]
MLEEIETSFDAMVLLGPDGQVRHSQGTDTHVDVLQSFGSSLHALADRALSELGGGRLRRLVVDGDQGRVALVQRPDGTALLGLLTADAPLGAAFSTLRRTFRRVA